MTENKYHIKKRIHFQSLDSTNTWAKINPIEWSPEGVTLVTADEQTKGRGRFTREWISPANLNIYASYCFFVEQTQNISNISQIMAIACAETLESTHFAPKIKWPNDILIHGKKIGGILSETIQHGEQKGVICGIGLNVNMPQEMLPLIDRPATSLLVEGKKLYAITPLLENLSEKFLTLLDAFLTGGFSPLFPLFQERCSIQKGDKISFRDHQSIIEGKCLSIQSDGTIEVLLPDNTSKIFYSCEFI